MEKEAARQVVEFYERSAAKMRKILILQKLCHLTVFKCQFSQSDGEWIKFFFGKLDHLPQNTKMFFVWVFFLYQTKYKFPKVKRK